MNRSTNRAFWMTAMTALLILAFFGTPAFADGERIFVRVDEPFEVNGHVYQPGTLSVRMLQAYTPSTSLNELWIGDQRLGMVMAKNSRSDPTTGVDSALFERNAEGRLVLVGYALRGATASHRFQYKNRREAVPMASTTGEPVVLLALSR